MHTVFVQQMSHLHCGACTNRKTQAGSSCAFLLEQALCSKRIRSLWETAARAGKSCS
ncbi:hypothetical protein BACCAP_01660 [Pseudoflavonifractor capillosus ATCC 29799]|uniref:Uncharacterized protein n=1 Tax=Pseudoflavonifractor capillosus ATCC 29799 TaxID=411467 RepID=A6NTX9_9FIRM|nr:hypothetical protein BACCAP_01660 [Pseudoflavonifractor capillosus ATCC 29799]